MNNWFINHNYDLCYVKWRIASCSDHKYVKLLHLGIFCYYLFCVQEVKWKNISKNFPTATTTSLHTNWHLDIYNILTWEKENKVKNFSLMT